MFFDFKENKENLVSSMINMSLNTIIIALLSFILNLVVSRKLGPKDYGIFDTLLTINAMIVICVSAVAIIITRFVSYYKTREQYDKMKYLAFWSFRFFLIVGIIFAVIIMLLSKSIAGFLKIEDYKLIYFFSILVAISFLVPIIEGILRGLQEFKLIGIYRVLDAVLRLIICIGLVFIGLKVGSLMLGFAIATIIALIISMYYMKNKYIVKPTKIEKFEIYKFALPVFICCIIIAILTNVDLILVKHVFNLEITGNFAAAGILAKISLGIAIAAAGVMFPKIVEYESMGYSKKSIKTLKETLKITFFSGLLITIILAIFPHAITSICFGSGYNIDYVLSIYVFATLILGLAIILMFFNLARKKYDFMYLIGIISIGEIYHLMNRVSTIYGVAWTLFVINSVVLGLMMWHNKKELFEN